VHDTNIGRRLLVDAQGLAGIEIVLARPPLAKLLLRAFVRAGALRSISLPR
jgi:hypothetical protein